MKNLMMKTMIIRRRLDLVKYRGSVMTYYYKTLAKMQMRSFEYEKAKLLNNESTRFTLINAINEFSKGDPVDSYNDAVALTKLMLLRLKQI